MKNKLEEVLLASGTGVINGFFRLPVRLISAEDYIDSLNDISNKINQTDTESINDAKKYFEELKEKLGNDIDKYEKFYQKPVINLSLPNGEPLGTYRIKDFDGMIGGDLQGVFILNLEKNENIKICVCTSQTDINGTWGQCEIYIDGEGEEILFQ